MNLTTSDNKLVNKGDGVRSELASSGEYGTKRISDTALYSGNFVEIVVIQDATFTTLTGNIDLGTLPQTVLTGTKLVGRVTEIQMSSGQIIVLRGE